MFCWSARLSQAGLRDIKSPMHFKKKNPESDALKAMLEARGGAAGAGNRRLLRRHPATWF